MTSQEAKEQLLLYRPGTADAEASEMAEALELMRQDAELGRWFAERCKVQIALQRRFQEIAVPAALREQIVSEYRASQRRQKLRRAAVAAAVACCALVIVALSLFKPEPADKSLTAFARRMAKEVRDGSYAMDLETNNVAGIRAYLAAKQGYADYAMPQGLQTVANAGCGILRWQNQKVSMICFRTGRPMSPAQKSDLFLFVVDRSAIANPPTSKQPVFGHQNRMVTATWIEGDRVYFLAATGENASLQKYF